MKMKGLLLVAILGPTACVGTQVMAGLMGRRAMGLDFLLVAIVFAGYSFAQEEGALQRTVLAFLAHLAVLALVLSIWTPMRQVLPILAMFTGFAAFVGFAGGRIGRMLVGGPAGA